MITIHMGQIFLQLIRMSLGFLNTEQYRDPFAGKRKPTALFDELHEFHLHSMRLFF